MVILSNRKIIGLTELGSGIRARGMPGLQGGVHGFYQARPVLDAFGVGKKASWKNLLKTPIRKDLSLLRAFGCLPADKRLFALLTPTVFMDSAGFGNDPVARDEIGHRV